MTDGVNAHGKVCTLTFVGCALYSVDDDVIMYFKVDRKEKGRK